MTGGRRWRVRLTAAAEQDLREIFRWTWRHFGERQAHVYAETLIRAIAALETGPHVAGAKRRDEMREGLMMLHVARKGRKGRHLVLYRVDSEADIPTVDVLRLLHDSMDLSRHIDSDRDKGR